MICYLDAAVDQKEDTPELREERIKLVKETMRKVIWHKYHKNISWEIGEWMNHRQPGVLVCEVSAKIEV